jgi:hypothetical protein
VGDDISMCVFANSLPVSERDSMYALIMPPLHVFFPGALKTLDVAEKEFMFLRW